MILNLYTHKGDLTDLTELQRSRFTEIEVWMLWKKLRMVTHYSQHSTVAGFIMALVNPEDTIDFVAIKKLSDYLTKSELLVPTHDEVIVYLRFHGLGLNKVTKATGRQHLYLKNTLYNYDTTYLVPSLTFDFKFIDYPELAHNIHTVAHDLFHMGHEDFYKEIDMYALKKVNKFPIK